MLIANTVHIQCMVFFYYSYLAYLSFGHETMTDPSATVSQYAEFVTKVPAPLRYMIIQLVIYLLII